MRDEDRCVGFLGYHDHTAMETGYHLLRVYGGGSYRLTPDLLEIFYHLLLGISLSISHAKRLDPSDLVCLSPVSVMV